MKLKLLSKNVLAAELVKKCMVCQKSIFPENLKDAFKVSQGHMKKGVFIQDTPSQYAHLACFEEFEKL